MNWLTLFILFGAISKIEAFINKNPLENSDIAEILPGDPGENPEESEESDRAGVSRELEEVRVLEEPEVPDVPEALEEHEVSQELEETDQPEDPCQSCPMISLEDPEDPRISFYIESDLNDGCSKRQATCEANPGTMCSNFQIHAETSAGATVPVGSWNANGAESSLSCQDDGTWLDQENPALADTVVNVVKLVCSYDCE
ncbi:DUF281 domain-containing protein [Caenorhabditis elegans]|uniref:DUF281 domain-containing protein n=1 Tax=Caenorhabditis elegans TaxID=6239 RepID=A0A5S9MMD2_CAEEL|nr:DUF281 domain-containing protein [Caenorhabditis elegans]CAA0059143.1 DUF281 domain-containing protein [Caenorhabditis elegans]